MKSRSRKLHVGLVLIPVLVAVLSGCVPSAGDGASSSAGSSSASTTAQTQATSGPTAQQPAGPAGPGAPQAEAPVVRWVPIGPVGPNDPTSGQRYLLLQQFQCDALAQSVQDADDAAVWLAAAAVCKAVQSGSQQDWQRASIAVAATPRIPQTQCLEYTVAATSAAMVAAQRSSQGLSPRVEPGPGEACPRHLSGLTVVDEQLKVVPGRTRASGPRSGGTIVRLDGYYVRIGDILFDGEVSFPETVSGDGDYQTRYLRMPASDGRDSIRISITDTVDISGTVTFFYDDSTTGPSPDPGGQTTPDPTESTPAPGPSSNGASSTAAP
ncbi:hypothetical protein ACIQC5_21775 [Paenarthrobacter sp. NPDC092416]|uniref:hypothetical protein n=1 Tax=Paenarthrobacter sp. NPDC092416 TaxID=3364386 RepID=UPI00380AEA38